MRAVANWQLRRLSFRTRLALIAFALIVVPIELLAHGRLAREYYDLNVDILQLTANSAVTVGARYLPAHPHAAVREANAYAERHGIARAEIVFIGLSSDNSVLTIRLERKVPRYMALLVLGGLPARDINVTASATLTRSRRIIQL
jgi:hypothetical protein